MTNTIGMSYDLVQTILKDNLEIRRICAKFVSSILIGDLVENRKLMLLNFSNNQQMKTFFHQKLLLEMKLRFSFMAQRQICSHQN